MFAFEVVEGKEETCQQAEDDAEWIKPPNGRIMCARDKNRSEQAQYNRQYLYLIELFLEDYSTENGSYRRGTEGENCCYSRAVVLHRKCPHGIEDRECESVKDHELPVSAVELEAGTTKNQ